jgi:iron complex outermembrane receptor protein
MFYYDYKDLQGEFFTGTTTFPYNVGSASIFGLDVDGQVALTDDFQLRASVTYLPRARNDHYPNAVVVEPYPTSVYANGIGPFGLNTVSNFNASGTRMNLAPEVTASMTGTYTTDTSVGHLDASGTLYYSSNYNLLVNGLVRQGSYFTFNADIGLVPTGWDNWRVGIYGHNLNAAAAIVGLEQPSSGLSAMYTPPREIGLELEYNY